MCGRIAGRRDVAEVTLFESLGLVHRRALAAGVGLRVDFGGLRDAGA